jgi:hypothetical protein
MVEFKAIVIDMRLNISYMSDTSPNLIHLDNSILTLILTT